jgi:hypothetical protein
MFQAYPHPLTQQAFFLLQKKKKIKMANRQADNNDIIVFIARVSNRYDGLSTAETCTKLIDGLLREAKRLYSQAYGTNVY